MRRLRDSVDMASKKLAMDLGGKFDRLSSQLISETQRRSEQVFSSITAQVRIQ